MVENKESVLITTIEDKTEGFIVNKKYLVIEFSDYNKSVLEDCVVEYKIVEVLELEE